MLSREVGPWRGTLERGHWIGSPGTGPRDRAPGRDNLEGVTWRGLPGEGPLNLSAFEGCGSEECW
jgi:hypothetical protein